MCLPFFGKSMRQEVERSDMSQSSIKFWDQVYKRTSPPWIGAEIPTEALAQFTLRLPDHSARVLDFGCGNGRLARHLERVGIEVIAADAAQHVLDGAVPLERGRYIRMERLSESERLGNFDGVLMWGVLHHYHPESWPEWLEEISRILRKNGIALIALFASSDTAFGGRKERISPTTGRLTYSANAADLAKLFSAWDTEMCEVITLSDGNGIEKKRSWIYVIARV